MRDVREQLRGLTQLHRVVDDGERRAAFRQAFATLATAATEFRPVPLEGLDPLRLRDSTRTALATGLFEDMTWLAPESAAAATYELAQALPSGDEKRDLGRRVLRALYEGNAATFVTVATQLATGSRRGLSGDMIRARVTLCLDLPIGSGIRADALALALISRVDLESEWLHGPSTGSLPLRRLAARLLERAAREAVRRVATGDESITQVFERPSVEGAFRRLLADREPLVWKHVAVARGLLSRVLPKFENEIADNLEADLTPTEWRRAAASLACTVALQPEAALAQCRAILELPALREDRGLGTAMIMGLSRAAEVEPLAALDLLRDLVGAGGLDALEAAIELRNEHVGTAFAEALRLIVEKRLEAPDLTRGVADDGRTGLVFSLRRELDEMNGEPMLFDRVRAVQLCYARDDAKTAFTRAVELLDHVHQSIEKLERAADSERGRVECAMALRDLDASLFETSTLFDLLMLGHKPEESGQKRGWHVTHQASIAFERISSWLEKQEATPIANASDVLHPMLRTRRVRTLLHVVDAELSPFEERAGSLKETRLRLAAMLLMRATQDAPSSLRRVVHAALARAYDALLREEQLEISDVFLTLVSSVTIADDLRTLSEAAMVPEISDLYETYAALMDVTERGARQSSPHIQGWAEALRAVLRKVPAAGAPRVEALRWSLLHLEQSLTELEATENLTELAPESRPEGSLLSELAEAITQLAWATLGARRRANVDVSQKSAPTCGTALMAVDLAVVTALRGESDALYVALEKAGLALMRDLPAHLSELILRVLTRIGTLPLRGPVRSVAPRGLRTKRHGGLPPWMPPGRTMGGFYVLSALGSGAVGSVFVARRVEDKTNEKAQKFALKVPEFGGNAAHTLSEREFSQLFREEAGALLAVPQHPNLAKLVTFDAGAQPKPILVMELVEGPTLERLLSARDMTMRRALTILDGVAAGLAAMHEVGVGHLDLKPSNVILHDPDGYGPEPERAVLVDFGLAGRKLRPGCATANYGAPEIWGLVPKGHTTRPQAADVYAFGCVVYETLTGRELFSGPSELAVIGSHLQHDANTPEIEALTREPGLRTMVELLRSALRQHPDRRANIEVLRSWLASTRDQLIEKPWPLVPV